MDEHRLLLRPPVWLPILVVLIAGGAYITGKKIESRPKTPAVISVQGEGKIFAVPDIAELTFGVQTGPRRSATDAMASLTEDMNAALAAVKAQGVEEKDIRTQSFNLNPQYDWVEGRQILRGFEAQQQLRVKVRDLDKVSAVLQAATEAGANQAGGVSFTIDDPEELRADARSEAIAEAQAKAEALADQLGVRLGDLQGFSEGGNGMQPPMPLMRAEFGMGGEDMVQSSVPMPAGEQEVVVTVHLVYEIKD